MPLPRIHVGAPINRGALTLFPLWTEHPEVEQPYLTGPAADAAKALTVDELDVAQVPQLLATNAAASPVLLLEGEVLGGGLQTRVLNLSILVPAMQSLPVPVACVEAGRWGDRRRSQRSATHSPPRLRHHKTASVNRAKAHGHRAADQGQVWESVAEYEDALAAPSMTSSYADVVHGRQTSLDELTEDLRPLPGQRGFVVGIGGTPIALELFGSAATFADYFTSLVTGYAVDALAAPPVATSASEARRFIRRVAKSEWALTDAVGLGREITIDGDDLAGHGLTLAEDEAPVHVAAFA